MPEGPEVSRIAEALHRHCHALDLLDLQILPTSRYYAKSGFKGVHLLQSGLQLKAVRSRGKKIIFEFDGSIYLLSFLGMEGHWVMQPTKHTSIVINLGKLIHLKNGRQLEIHQLTIYYEDSRHFGTFEVFNDQVQFEKAFKAIGPDLLHEQISLEHYVRVIKTRTLQDKEIAWFLLEQKYFSGVGNYLRSEILYLSCIAPHRIIGTLSDEEISRLHRVSMSLIREAYMHNGLSFSTYVDPDGNRGTYEPHVYKQSHDRYGNAVMRSTGKEGRTVHWVPEIQV